MRRVDKIAVANRGEVAVRIIRACQELNIATVLLHSEADEGTLAYRLSDEQICIGPAPSLESYLNIDNNIQAAKSMGADAIHPGFGFLSENANFAKACEENRMIFIGPSASTIELFGDKISAKKLVEKVGGPLLPGYQGEDQSLDTLMSECDRIGYPLMVKAAAGGGGRGIRVVQQASEAKAQILSAQKEAKSAFGSEKVFLEKYLADAKHIEVQIFGDCTGRVYHLFDRECSIQRRHQKVIEESLSPSLRPQERQQMLDWAVKIAKEAQYRGAGTVEFLYQEGQFYFLEMNTRLQVEHPVTEMVLNVDLVKAQILTAQERGLLWEEEDLRPMGHAIECRLYAEDCYNKGIPSTGPLLGCHWPMGPGRRFEIGFEAGDEITSYYDPMIAKVVVWDENRPRAIQKMIQTLKESVLFGVKTNIDELIQILSHTEFREGSMTTSFMGRYFAQGLQEKEVSEDEQEGLQKVFESLPASSGSGGWESTSPQPSPWQKGKT